jgi:hypothetical protein
MIFINCESVTDTMNLSRNGTSNFCLTFCCGSVGGFIVEALRDRGFKRILHANQ